MKKTRPVDALPAVALSLLLAWGGPGCTGYRLGSTLPPDIKTLFIPTFINRSTEPLIEIEATNKTIAEFQKDGTLKIGRPSDADAILEVTIQSVSLTPLRYDRTDRASPNEYRMSLTASYVFKRAADNRVIDDGAGVVGESTFPYAGDLMAAKRSALPSAAEDLGRRLVELVVEAW